MKRKMKANELMIADWVMFQNGTDQVQEIYALAGNAYLKEYGTIDASKLSPIPLTSEILKSNGFNCEEIIQPHWISEDGRILLRNDESLINSNNKWSVHVDNEDMQTIGYFELTYVHQLQHALRLCEIEKEIEI